MQHIADPQRVHALAGYTLMHGLRGLEKVFPVILNISMHYSSVTEASIVGHLSSKTKSETQQVTCWRARRFDLMNLSCCA